MHACACMYPYALVRLRIVAVVAVLVRARGCSGPRNWLHGLQYAFNASLPA